jgi:hypothetical protein
MRASDGFDRVSTEEELHQVLAVLNEFARNGWSLPGEDQAEPQETALWADTVLDEPAEAESLANLLAKKPETTN